MTFTSIARDRKEYVITTPITVAYNGEKVEEVLAIS
jgi:hypothetical protein